jgi:hypothetical protein
VASLVPSVLVGAMICHSSDTMFSHKILPKEDSYEKIKNNFPPIFFTVPELKKVFF